MLISEGEIPTVHPGAAEPRATDMNLAVSVSESMFPLIFEPGVSLQPINVLL